MDEQRSIKINEFQGKYTVCAAEYQGGGSLEIKETKQPHIEHFKEYRSHSSTLKTKEENANHLFTTILEKERIFYLFFAK